MKAPQRPGHLLQLRLTHWLMQVEGSWSAETVMTVLSHLDTESELLPPGFTADLAEAVAA